MLNRETTYMVTRVKGIRQDYLSSYHLGMMDHVTESTWSEDELCAIHFDTEDEAKVVSDRFPGTFVQEFMEYEDEDER